MIVSILYGEDGSMSKDYKASSDEELLNYEEPNTAQVSRYARIMQHRSNEATMQLAKQLRGVTETVYRASQGPQEKASELLSKIDEARAIADAAIVAAEAAAVEQRKQQRTVTLLTVALAVCTLVYTITNAVGAYQAKQGNQIQARIGADAREQLAVSREANALEQASLHPNPVQPPAVRPRQPEK